MNIFAETILGKVTKLKYIKSVKNSWGVCAYFNPLNLWNCQC